MATSADHPGIPITVPPGVGKGVPVTTQSGTSLGCLPRHSRQSSGNYPDVVDSDNCFQSVISDSAEDLCDVGVRSLQSADEAVSPSTSGVGSGQMEGGTYRSLSDANIPNQRASTSSGDDIYSGGDNVRLLRDQPSVDVIQRNSQPPPYRADSRPIRTHDLNVGVTGRLDNQRGEAIPDLLFSHMVPQVPPSRPNQHRQGNRGNNERGGRRRGDNHGRHHSRNHQREARQSHGNRRSRTQLQMYQQHRETCKEPCLKCLSSVTSFKCVLVLLSLIGVCCVITGIVLGALHAVAVAKNFLFLAIMFLGLGILLVVVVFVGWRCTPRGHEPCHALFGLGDHRRHRRRHGARAHRPRDGNWYGGVLYPEFGHRRPPPSYAASMQEYQQQLVLAQQQYMDSMNTDNYSLPSSPPPTYRSHVSVRPGIPITFPPSQTGQYPNSRPPTYRSHSSTIGQQQPHSRPALPLDQSGDLGTGESSGVSQVNIAVEGTAPGVETVTGSLLVPSNNVSNTNGAHGVASSSLGSPSSQGVAPPAHPPSDSDNSNSTTSSPGHPPSIHQSPSSSQGGEESVENLLETTLRTFDEITNSVVSTDYDSINNSSQSSGENPSVSVSIPVEPHTNTITSQTPL